MRKGMLALMIVLVTCSFAFGAEQKAKPFKLAAIFQTAIEEPWDGVIHQACLKAKKEIGNIDYEFAEKEFRLARSMYPSLGVAHGRQL